VKFKEFILEQKEQGFHTNIEQETLKNTNWRKVLYTTLRNQLVVMSVPPLEELGEETHPKNAQFIRVEQGDGKAIIGGIEYKLSDGSAVIVPANVKHNIINTSDSEDLKIYTVYSPPHHPGGTLHKTKEDEKAAEIQETENLEEGKVDNKIKTKIISFFKKNPNPTDGDIHSFAGKLGINAHKFEEYIYAILSDLVA